MPKCSFLFMYRILYVFCLFFVFIAKSSAEPDFAIPKIDPKMTALYTIHQKDIDFENKRYRLFIAEPKIQQHNLSVFYTLDGNAQFPLAVNAVNANLPLPLIVGIGYVSDKAYVIEARRRDYTFSVQGDEFKQGGGAKDFLRFIQTNVKPSIEANYKINPEKQYLFGHSFGGLFGLYVLFHQPDLFQYYTLASPSLWWGNGTFLPKNEPWIKFHPKHILVTLGEYEEYPEQDPKMTLEQQQRIEQRKKMRPFNAQQLAEKLQAQGENATFKWIPNKNHGDSVIDAMKYSLDVIQNER